MTDAQKQTIRARLAEWRDKRGRATQGKWQRGFTAHKEADCIRVGKQIILRSGLFNDRDVQDMDFCVHAANTPLAEDVEALLVEVERLQVDAELGRLVRAMPECVRLVHNPFYSGGNVDEWEVWDNAEKTCLGQGSFPEEALRRAGEDS